MRGRADSSDPDVKIPQKESPSMLNMEGLTRAPGRVRLEGFEPPASGTGIQRSIQLSYKRKGDAI
jgi:hypothetical protein